MKDTPTSFVDISHHIQRGILLQLRQNGVQTYQQLKPDGVEGNAYNYHLRSLKQAGLISSEDKNYQLTTMGQVVTDSFSFSSERLVLRPHVYTHILVTSQNKVLLYSPTRQPLPGIMCLPSGKLHYGDTFKSNIVREMNRRDLTGEYEVTSMAPINVCYKKDDAIIRQRPGHLWHIAYTGPLAESATESGSAAWYDIATINDQPAIAAEVAAALTHLKTGSTEPIELTIAV